MGCDLKAFCRRHGICEFQSTHPRGVRLRNWALDFQDFLVSIHAPAWGATGERGRLILRQGGFNPRTRVGCDITSETRPQDCLVSIHAPAWGATCPRRPHANQIRVSIHAPAWGATWTAQSLASPTATFQSTHPRGVRPSATTIPSTSRPCFNPRTRVGCDPWSAWPRMTMTEFQSTHPRGVRHQTGTFSHRALTGFNPRTRVGCDALASGLRERRIRVSIHAPAWGATCGHCPAGLVAVEVSIHAPAWGATLGHLLDRELGSVSIHAPAWGATRPSGLPSPRGRKGFNPRTRVGCDVKGVADARARFIVSIHAPAWGATAGCPTNGSRG